MTAIMTIWLMVSGIISLTISNAKATSSVEQLKVLDGNPGVSTTIRDIIINGKNVKLDKDESIRDEKILKYYEEKFEERQQDYKNQAERIKNEEIPYNFNKGRIRVEYCVFNSNAFGTTAQYFLLGVILP